MPWSIECGMEPGAPDTGCPPVGESNPGRCPARIPPALCPPERGGLPGWESVPSPRPHGLSALRPGERDSSTEVGLRDPGEDLCEIGDMGGGDRRRVFVGEGGGLEVQIVRFDGRSRASNASILNDLEPSMVSFVKIGLSPNVEE